MGEPVLLRETAAGILVLTLNRPEVMNALNFELLGSLREEIERIRFETDVRVLILTGAGERAFCAGADLKERAGLSETRVREYLFNIRNLFSAIEQLNKPVIAAVNGIALGGGTEMALASDIRLAARHALMGLTETKLAIIPGGGGTQRLPRLIGRGRAKELIFTGRRVDAAEAERIGLVNRVCDSGALLAECKHMAAQICEAGPIAVEQAKYAINHGLETDIQTGLAIEFSAYQVTIPTQDRLEGLAAFREKRKPVFKGK